MTNLTPEIVAAWPKPTGWHERAHAELIDALNEAAVNKPADCTCDGLHTDSAPGVPVRDLEVLLAIETCPAERRALVRIIDSPALRAR